MKQIIMAKRATKKSKFLDRFDLADAYLLKPDARTGKLGLLEATSSQGEAVLIRLWKRTKADDGDLVAIWRNELRLLHRLAGTKGATNCIARMVEAGEDDDGFYIAVSVGQRRPLALFLDGSLKAAPWMRQPSNPAYRRRLWLNLMQAADAVEILHSQGLIHGSIDEYAVLTAGAEEPDFLLTGFEWSMRVASVPKRASKTAIQRRFSFFDDWRSFSLLAARLFKVDTNRLENPRIAPFEVSDNLLAEEAALLRTLIDPPNQAQIDGEYVRRKIEEIVTSLGGTEASEIGQYQLFLNLASNSVKQAIRDAADLSIGANDQPSMVRFVENDISDGARLICCGSDADRSVFLRGRQLVYKIAKYTTGTSSDERWEFAKCDSAELSEDWWSGNITGSTPIARELIAFASFLDAKAKSQRLRSRVPSWETLIQKAIPRQSTKNRRDDRFYRALSLLHALNLVIASADTFPVRIKETGTATDGSRDVLLSMLLEPDAGRLALRQSLGIRSYDERLRELVDGDRVSEDQGWLLTDTRLLTKRSGNDAELQFEEVRDVDGSSLFVFRALKHRGITLHEGMLVPGDFRGRLAQFKRTSQALKWLREHSELLRTLADPQGAVTASHEAADEGTVSELDPSKRVAFEEIISTLPFYLVQGPPGVGKTFLVRELVRKSFRDEASSRILLSGQSHHTVDHLLKEVLSDWADGDSDPPLAVRCKVGEVGERTSKYDVAKQSSQLIKQFSQSSLALTCGKGLQERIAALSESALTNSNSASNMERRAVEGLVLRSANLVFATTNARDLERLVEERGQFDWTIVEEAAKASGGELLMPLLLSHRRLLIGDHFQLPPFGSEQIQRVLAKPASVREALSGGLANVHYSFKEFIDDDLMTLFQDETAVAELEQMCGDANRALLYFANTVDDELERQKRSKSPSLNIAHRLNIQHRMHPTIAGMISACFYQRSIDNSAESLKKFSGPSPVALGGALSEFDAPLVVVDMPYQQETLGNRHAEKLPRYTNLDEAEAVRMVLSHLEVRSGDDKRPTLGILSPYSRQVKLLRERSIANEQELASLAAFSAVGRGGEYHNTVDAFQGNEADAVIASLVRNNHHSAVTRALGFIANPQRMNVLLSRARWRLVIVASLGFLESVLSPIGAEVPNDAIFLRTFLDTLHDLKKTGHAKVVPFAKLTQRGNS